MRMRDQVQQDIRIRERAMACHNVPDSLEVVESDGYFMIIIWNGKWVHTGDM